VVGLGRGSGLRGGDREERAERCWRNRYRQEEAEMGREIGGYGPGEWAGADCEQKMLGGLSSSS
jgi:hypothetical protein